MLHYRFGTWTSVLAGQLKLFLFLLPASIDLKQIRLASNAGVAAALPECDMDADVQPIDGEIQYLAQGKPPHGKQATE